MVFEANTCNKTEHTLKKGMENCARKGCLFPYSGGVDRASSSDTRGPGYSAVKIPPVIRVNERDDSGNQASV